MAEARPSSLRLGLVLAMTAWVAAHSRFWSGTYDAATHVGADYVALRTERAFYGTPIGPIASRLDELLPRETPIALSPGLVQNDGLRQRLCEGLYPRRVDRNSAELLTLARDGSVRTPVPDPSRLPQAKPPAVEAFGFDLAGLLAAAGALFGFGGLVVSVMPGLRSHDDPIAGLGTVLLAGCAVVGGIVYIATLAQVPMAWWALRVLGWACLACAAFRLKPWRGLRGSRPSLEGGLAVALVAFVFFRMAVLPIDGWDGRSIWLFNAKRIYFQGMHALADLRQADWEWSHPVYPFFAPGLMAFFGGAGRVFNERIAALAVPVLWGAALLVYAGIARRLAGRALGVALTLLLFFATQGLVGELYMDGLVAALVALLAVTRARSAWLPTSLLVAFALSLVKVEGAIAAAAILVVSAIAGRRELRGGRATAALYLTPFILPIAHRAWLTYHHVSEFQARIGISSVRQLSEKLSVVRDKLPDLLLAGTSGQQAETQAMLQVGLAGLLAGLAFLAFGRGAVPESLRAVLLGSGALLVVVAVAVVCAMPQDAAWLVQWTLDRLLLHPAVLFAMLPFL